MVTVQLSDAILASMGQKEIEGTLAIHAHMLKNSKLCEKVSAVKNINILAR